MLQFLALALLLSSTAADPKLHAEVNLRCELFGDNVTSAIAWSMDDGEDMKTFNVENNQNNTFYANNGTMKLTPFKSCSSNLNHPLCTAKGWNNVKFNTEIKSKPLIGPVLDLRWEGLLRFTSSSFNMTITGSESLSVLASNMTFLLDFKRKNMSTFIVKIMLDEHDTNDTKNVSSSICSSDQNEICTELKRIPGQILDSRYWVHLTFNIKLISKNNVSLQLFRHGVKGSLFDVPLGDVIQTVNMNVKLNGSHKKHHYVLKHTTNVNSHLEITLKGGCWYIIHYGYLRATTLSINNSTQRYQLKPREDVVMGFVVTKLPLPQADVEYNITFIPEQWSNPFWAIGDILPCYKSRMRNLSGIPLEKVNEVHCTSLLDGISSEFNQTRYEIVTVTLMPKVEAEYLPEVIEDPIWFYVAISLLLILLLILIVAAILIQRHFQFCVRDPEPFYRRRGSIIVAMKLQSMKKRGNDAALFSERYVPAPGNAQGERIPEDPDYELIKVHQDTLPAHVPRVPNDLAPPAPPERPASTFEDPQYDKVYDNFGLRPDISVKRTTPKHQDVESDGPEYGNFVANPAEKKSQVIDEDPEYGNIVVPIPMKNIVVTADIEAPEYGNFAENVPGVKGVKKEPEAAETEKFQDDPIYGNF